MVLSISISPDTEARLREQARAAGKDVASYVAELVAQAAARPTLDQILQPLREEFARSGMSDEALTEHIVEAQRAHRAANQKKSA